ncbi:MAG TPA: DUF3830 family protein [Chloroflexota bacterium]|jgi:hypothetical protein
MLRLTIGTGDRALVLDAKLENERAGQTVQTILSLLPFRGKILQGRWSGESGWIPIDDWQAASSPSGGAPGPAAAHTPRRFDLAYENHTSFPAPGELLFYCFGLSVTEILVPYGPTVFASRVGQLAGNHFATVTSGREGLRELGRRVLWEGAQEVLIELRDDDA